MSDPSPEKLKTAVQALYQVRAVEGPPEDNGQRSVWHMCAQGAELLSLVDLEGRLQRQELTLLEDHYMWTSGEGLRTGRVEHGGSKAGPASAIIHPDPQLVPFRLVRAALALASYEGEDRYILHMKRVLALAREGLELQEASLVTRPAGRRGVEPPGAVTAHERTKPVPEAAPNVPASSRFEGRVVLVVLGMGVIAAIVLLVWLL